MAAVGDVAYVIAKFDDRNQPTGYVKVGKTTKAQVDTRLSKLQTGNPRRLKFLLRYVAQRPFQVESHLQGHIAITLSASPADQLTPDNYAERSTEWYSSRLTTVSKGFSGCNGNGTMRV